MNKAQINALYDQDQRINVGYPGMIREITADAVRLVDMSDRGEGVVIFSGLNEGNAEDVIREQIRYFEGIGQDFEWKVYDYDPPADLKERLGSFGFEVEEAEALLVLDLEDAPEVLWQPVRHDVQRIVNADELGVVQRIEEEVWDEDASWVHDYLGGALCNDPERMSVYVAYVDGHAVSAAWTYFPERSQFASLWGGATISGFRKQGLYTALLAVRAQEAKARQVRYLTVDASVMSRPILEKFGFEMIAYSYPCKWRVRTGR